jgi:uncharacterized protein involved in response to NO
LTPSPLWASAFRPFYFLGALYAPLLAAVWLGAYLGFWSLAPGGVSLRLLHGHEFIYGFSTAIIAGVVLTALPSWAGTEEIDGQRLMLLVALWLAGRIAFWSAPWLPAPLPALIDCLLFPSAILMLLPQLLRAKNRLYLLLLPILLALFAGNLAYYQGITAGNEALAWKSLRLAIYAIVVLYVLKGGVLAPIFTGNALREKGRGGQASFVMPLEFAATTAVVLLAACDLGGAPAAWTGASALACTLLHAWRCIRWQGWRVADVPLLLVMHLGFAWLVAAFALKAVAELSGLVPEAAWLHAFTVGSLGLMMLGLMTRVSLRHTGRPLVVPHRMLAAYALVFAAALLRLAATIHNLGPAVIALAAALWAAAFALYFHCFWRSLLAPSLPRPAPSNM